MSLVYRAFESEVSTDGHTLEGLAYRYDTPSWVSDDGRTRYREAYRSSTGMNQPVVGLHLAHPTAANVPLEPRTLDSFGSVEFTPTAEGLAFRALVDDSELGNAALIMLAAGGLSKMVSIGAKILESETVRDVTYRTQIEIFELSLLPNGQRGALTGAEIQVVRNALELVPSRLIRHRLKLALIN